MASSTISVIFIVGVLLSVITAEDVPQYRNCTTNDDCSDVPNRPICKYQRYRVVVSKEWDDGKWEYTYGYESGKICSPCEMSSQCPSHKPVCTSSGACEPCKLDPRARCRVTTSNKAQSLCNKVLGDIAAPGKTNCVPEFAAQLLKPENAGFYSRCQCFCSNRDNMGKKVLVNNPEACHLRFFVARFKSLLGQHICPEDFDIKCELGAVCPDGIFTANVKFFRATLRKCPNTKISTDGKH